MLIKEVTERKKILEVKKNHPRFKHLLSAKYHVSVIFCLLPHIKDLFMLIENVS